MPTLEGGDDTHPRKDLSLCSTRTPAADPWADGGPSLQVSLQPFPNRDVPLLRMNNLFACLIEKGERGKAAKMLKISSEEKC